jgi:hypothetical protein
MLVSMMKQMKEDGDELVGLMRVERVNGRAEIEWIGVETRWTEVDSRWSGVKIVGEDTRPGVQKNSGQNPQLPTASHQQRHSSF